MAPAVRFLTNFVLAMAMMKYKFEFLYQFFLPKILCPVYHHYYKRVITLSDSYQLRLCGSSRVNIAPPTHPHTHTHTHARTHSTSGK